MKALSTRMIILAAACSLGVANRAMAIPFDIACGSAVNVDTNPATVVSCNIASVGTVTDLNLVINIDDLTGTPYATDLQIDLVQVATSISVSVYVGSQVANPQSVLNATFDDAAAGAPPGSGNIIGTFLPGTPLSAFNGLELSGNWNLVILDTSPYPNEGIDLIQWRLTGTYVPEPGSGVLLGIGLLGLAILSGRKHVAPLARY